MKIDKKFTQLIQDWLNADNNDADHVVEGAQLLVRINPKNVTYRRFLNMAFQRPIQIEPKIRYELKTHLRYRLDGLTLEQVNRLDRTVIPETAKILSYGAPEETPDTDGVRVIPCSSAADNPGTSTPLLGRRADHDALPDDIKKLWDDNAALYKDIKALFEELKAMEDLPSCQRYDKLQILAAMDDRYRKNFAAYDAANPAPAAPAETPEPPGTAAPSGTAETPAPAVTPETPDTDEVRVSPCSSAAETSGTAVTSGAAESPAAISSARSYITKNVSKLKKLIAEKKDAAKLRENIQQRVDTLIAANAAMKPETIDELKTLGIIFPENEE